MQSGALSPSLSSASECPQPQMPGLFLSGSPGQFETVHARPTQLETGPEEESATLAAPSRAGATLPPSIRITRMLPSRSAELAGTSASRSSSKKPAGEREQPLEVSQQTNARQRNTSPERRTGEAAFGGARTGPSLRCGFKTATFECANGRLCKAAHSGRPAQVRAPSLPRSLV